MDNKDDAATRLAALQEKRLSEILDPSHSALIIIDMQNDFISPDGISAAKWHKDISSMQAIVPKIEAVTELFYSQNRPVIRVINYEDPEMRTLAGLDRFSWFELEDKENEVSCLKGTWGAELYMPAREGDIVIEKYRISAYAGTELNRIIADLNIRTMVVTGVKTQRCVASTIRDLYDNEPNLHVVTLEDCIASNDHVIHKAMVEELRNFYPPVITSQTLADFWRNS